MAPRGFTLVEIVIVLTIAAVLLWIAVPTVQAYIERARVAQAVSEIGPSSAVTISATVMASDSRASA